MEHLESKEKGITISTVELDRGNPFVGVVDALMGLPHTYETAIKNEEYNSNRWVIVETYETEKKAREGHEKWINQAKKGLPNKIKDVNINKDFKKER